MEIINDNFDINNNQTEKYKRAKKRIKKIKSFYIHLTVYIIINVYIAIEAFINIGIEGVGFSFMGVGFFWGIGLFFHWYGVFGKSLLFSKDWEKRKIKELMEKDNQNKN